jgi:hypothetical protein
VSDLLLYVIEIIELRVDTYGLDIQLELYKQEVKIIVAIHSE